MKTIRKNILNTVSISLIFGLSLSPVLCSTGRATTSEQEKAGLEVAKNLAGERAAFIYQGQLKDGGGLVSGAYDLQFNLYSAQIGGEELESIEIVDLSLLNGLFRVRLDFGRHPAQAGTGAETKESWLQIGVRPGGSTEPYTVLSPRQKLTPTPYAIFAQHEQWSLIGVPVGFAGVKGEDTDLLTADEKKVSSADNEASITKLAEEAIKSTKTGNGTVTSATASPTACAQPINCDASGAALSVTNTGQSGASIGVQGISQSSFGVEGRSVNLSGVAGDSENGNGVFGQSEKATGVLGISSSGVGVRGEGRGQSASIGVQGISQNSFGVEGRSVNLSGVAGDSENGNGVFGQSAKSKGVLGISEGDVGVQGESTSGIGALGKSSSNNGVEGRSGSRFGVRGMSNSFPGVAGESASTYGVQGSSDKGLGGVAGLSTSGVGVRGQSESSIGVIGSSKTNSGVQGQSTSGVGVSGISGTGRGVEGISTGAAGVAGLTMDSGKGGVVGGCPALPCNAVVSVGDLLVQGRLLGGAKLFHTDHPLDPANKYLNHVSVESPDMMNIYNGIVTLDGSGEAVVELPAWFEALNKDFRYQLTAIGMPGPNLYIAEQVAHNRFKIAGGSPSMGVSWQVTGIRHDAWADAHRIVVEESKTANERGYYLNPELFGQPEEKGIAWLRQPDLMQQMKQMRQGQPLKTVPSTSMKVEPFR